MSGHDLTAAAHTVLSSFERLVVEPCRDRNASQK
jgi:hypothetical protein